MKTFTESEITQELLRAHIGQKAVAVVIHLYHQIRLTSADGIIIELAGSCHFFSTEAYNEISIHQISFIKCQK